MEWTKKCMLVLTFSGGALVAAPGLAQVPPDLPVPESVSADAETAKVPSPDAYGTTATTVLTIPATAFISQSSADVLTVFFDTGAMYRSSGNAAYELLAPVHLPAGAVITGLGFDGYDVDPSLNIAYRLRYVSQNIANTSGTVAGFQYPTSAGWFTSTAALAVPHTVDPGNYYFAGVDLNKNGQDMRVKGMRIQYKLQVSPAPASATFSDVPTNHWAFKWIEALAASGVTTGCAAGKYCPNNPITRAEMAVFLSEALGLHWPN